MFVEPSHVVMAENSALDGVVIAIAAVAGVFAESPSITRREPADFRS